MTEQIKDGGPAFPGTLRDFFAGEALKGLLSDSATMGNISKDAKELKVNPAIYIARASYEFADAMLKAREV